MKSASTDVMGSVRDLEGLDEAPRMRFAEGGAPILAIGQRVMIDRALMIDEAARHHQPARLVDQQYGLRRTRSLKRKRPCVKPVAQPSAAVSMPFSSRWQLRAEHWCGACRRCATSVWK